MPGRPGPARRGDDAVQVVRDLVDRLPITVVLLSVEIAVTAAELRARHRSLRLPDALVIATAVDEGAERLVTTDRRWPTARRLGIELRVDRL